jgi:hypothetical protein
VTIGWELNVADAMVADVSFILTLYKFKLNVFLEIFIIFRCISCLLLG